MTIKEIDEWLDNQPKIYATVRSLMGSPTLSDMSNFPEIFKKEIDEILAKTVKAKLKEAADEH